MYDSEYFRKVIGNNYKPEELIHNNDEENKIYSVNTQIQSNVKESEDTQIVSNNNINEISQEVSNRINQENNCCMKQSLNLNNIKPNGIYEKFNNAPTTEIIQNCNDFELLQNDNLNNTAKQFENYNGNNNIKVRYPEIYYVIQPMVEKIVQENQNIQYTEEVIHIMTMEIYNALEVDINPTNTTNMNNNTPKNHALHDLIMIMLINYIY